MKRVSGKFLFFGLIALMVFPGCNDENQQKGVAMNKTVLIKTDDPQLTYLLPSPKTDGTVSVEKALANRRSHRMFQNRELSAEQLSQILWAAYGITIPMSNRPSGGLRTTPSAGALFPLEMYVVVGNVADVETGLYKYVSKEHKIVRTRDRDVRAELSAAALNQVMIKDAPITVVYTAVFDRITTRYGERGRERYVFMEIGHSAQNVYLQAEALGLGTCAIGAFQDDKVSESLGLAEEEKPFYLMPTGYFK